MVSKKLLPVALILLCVPSVFSQSEDFWISPGAEFAFYSPNGGAYGGGFALGYGSGTSIGLKAVYLMEGEYKIKTLELNILLRFYFQGRYSYSGPFMQILGGPVIFARDAGINIPSRYGIFSAGAGFGWRFLFNERWFAEPQLRAGYPYAVGLGVSGGVRF